MRPQPFVAFHQLLLEGVLFLRHRAGDDNRLAGFQPGRGQVDHLGRLHVGKGTEHLLEFREIGEFGEPAAWSECRAVRGDFHGVDNFAEGGGPPVKMVDATLNQALRVEEALHGVHFYHRVADGRAGGKRHAVAGMLLVQIARLHVEVESLFAAAGLDAGDALHFRCRLQILLSMQTLHKK